MGIYTERNTGSANIVSVLEKALKGAHMVKDDTSTTAMGRNFLFELVTASHFVRQGMRIKFEGDADFITEINGADVFVECKRGINIESLLKDAFKQIVKRCKVECNPPSAGIAAICITPMITQNVITNGLLIVPGELIQKTMEENASKFDFSNFQKYCPPGLGVFIHSATPYWEISNMSLEILRRNDFYPLREEGDTLLLNLNKYWK